MCGKQECLRAHLANQAHDTLSCKREEFRKKIAQFRDRALTELGIQESATIPLAVIPYAPAPLHANTAERLEPFRQHLASIINRAFDPSYELESTDRESLGSASLPETSSEVSAVLGQACGQCQGYCCRTGAGHAWLRVETIRRYVAAHPETTLEDVMDVYLSIVPSESYENSCAYHRRDGCALPKEMRSGICNEYICPGLKSFVDQLRPGRRPRGLFIGASGMDIKAVALIEPASIQVVEVAADP